jgi:hypothetical protein
MQAIDNVMHVRQIRQYYKDLEHMVRYELGMPDLWVEIQAERDKLIEEARVITQLQQQAERQSDLKRQLRIDRFKQRLNIYVALLAAMFSIILFLFGLTWLVTWDREWRWGY